MAIRLAILILSILLCFGDDNPYVCILDNGQEIAIGESASVDGECQQVTCESEGFISAKACGQYFPAPGCHFTQIDYSKPYPECCPQHVCNDEKD